MTIRNNSRRMLKAGTALATGLIGFLYGGVALAQSLPTGGSVAVGTADISTAGATMTVDVRQNNPVILWDSFNVALGNTVNFTSTSGPALFTVDNAPRAVLNRVVGVTSGGPPATVISPSIIAGTLSGQSNIAIWLVNPAGVTFSSTGTYNGGSLILSTLDVPNAQFIAAASTQFSKHVLGGSETLGGTATQAITLTGGVGAGTIVASGGIILLGEKIDVGKTASSGGAVSMVAAQNVTFASGVGSPLSFTINTGTALSGVHVLGGQFGDAGGRVAGRGSGFAVEHRQRLQSDCKRHWRRRYSGDQNRWHGDYHGQQ
jgi:filamentous hemagglutinin family protein